MAQVVRQGEINLAALKANGVYVLVAEPANTSLQGVETGIVGLVGTASWGPINTPKRLGSQNDDARIFGVMRDAPHDLPTDAFILRGNRVPVIVGVRVTDGTDAKSLAQLSSASSADVTLGGDFHAGDVIAVTVAGVTVEYAAKTADATLAGVAEALAVALNSNLAFSAVATAFADGAKVKLVAKTVSNAITLVAAVTGEDATITATASGATFSGGGVDLGDYVALYSGLEGDGIEIEHSVNANSTAANPLWDVTIVRPSVAASETFTALPEATFGAALVAALQNGQGPSRGPSELVRFVPDSGAAAAPPSQVAFKLSGGANGDASLTSGQQLGTNLAIPATGMYALKGQGVQKMGLCGLTDTATFATQVAFAKQIGTGVLLACPPNMTTAAAIALKKALGIADYVAWLAKDWVQFLDPVNNTLRLVPPTAFALGRIASLTPDQSPGNKPIELVVATERSLADMPYSDDEAGLLTDAGILFITNPVPGGAYWGLAHGLNTSANSATNGIEYTNMTHFLAYSLAGGFGEFIDKNQTTRNDDPLRAQASRKFNSFLFGLKQDGLIEDYSVDMSFGEGKVNTAQSVRDGFMKAIVRVQYKSVVRFFVVTLIGGKTVDVKVQ